MAKIICVVAIVLCLAYKSDIVSGSKAVVYGQSPFHASLRYSGGEHFCSGAIINQNWIITAADCVATTVSVEDIRIVVGTTHLNESNRIYTVEKVVVHDAYHGDFRKHKYNVALIKTEDDIETNDFLRIYSVPVDNRWIYGGQLATVIGYNGKTYDDELHFTYMTTLEVDECNDRFKMGRSFVDLSTLCADPTTTIAYDLGSPMLIGSQLVGIAMPYMQVRSIEPVPQRFTRISLCIEWIEKVTAEHD